MVEVSSLGEFFLHRNVTYKLLKQNCKTNLCGNACANKNIALKFTIVVKISLIDCKNLYISKEVSLLLAEGKRLSHLQTH